MNCIKRKISLFIMMFILSLSFILLIIYKNNFKYDYYQLKFKHYDDQEALNILKSKIGLWFVFSHECQTCEEQYHMLKNTFAKSGFYVRYISVDGVPLKSISENNDDYLLETGQVKQLNLKVTPTIVMIRPPNHFYIISQGEISSKNLSFNNQQQLLIDKLIGISSTIGLIEDVQLKQNITSYYSHIEE